MFRPRSGYCWTLLNLLPVLCVCVSICVCNWTAESSELPPPNSENAVFFRAQLIRNSELLDENLEVAVRESRHLAEAATEANVPAVVSASLMQLSCALMGSSGVVASSDSFDRSIQMMPDDAPPLERLLFAQAMFRRSRWFGKLATDKSAATLRMELANEGVDRDLRLRCLCDYYSHRNEFPSEESPDFKLFQNTPSTAGPAEPNPVQFRFHLLRLKDELRRQTAGIPDLIAEIGTWPELPEFIDWPRQLRIDVLRTLADLHLSEGDHEIAAECLRLALAESRELHDRASVCACEVELYEAEFQNKAAGKSADAFPQLSAFVSIVSDPDLLHSLAAMAARENRAKKRPCAEELGLISDQIVVAQRHARETAERINLRQVHLARLRLAQQASTISTVQATADAQNRWSTTIVQAGLAVFVGLVFILARERWQLRRMNQHLNEQIRRNEEQAREKERIELRMAQIDRLDSLGSLAGGIAHDFNNLLVGVIGNADLLRNSESLPPSMANRCLEGIVKSAQTAAELSRKMLAYAGKAPAERRVIELNDLIERMLPLLQSGLRGHQNVTFLPHHGPLPAEGDSGQLEQVLLNLVSNAIQSMGDAQKSIVLRTGQIHYDEIPVDVPAFGKRKTGGDFIWFEVEDQGKGIPGPDLARVFEPFFTTRADTTGHGLGLAVVYGHVNRHDGLIQVWSEVGIKTRFRVLLPRAVNVRLEASDLPNQPSAIVPARCRHIMVVDDQRQVIDVVKRTFEFSGCEVSTFSSAGDALEFLVDHNTSVDCIFVDIMMPVMDGVEMLEVLASKNMSIPVVVMSGNSPANLHQFMRYSFVKSVLQKPFRSDDLFTAIRQVESGFSGNDDRRPMPLENSSPAE